MSDVTRRQFSLGALGAVASTTVMSHALPGLAGEAGGGEIKIGLIADIHHGVIHDGEMRLRTFIDRMNEVKPDFVMQMGDFCYPSDKYAKSFMAEWHRYKGEKYHVIGNHDMDHGFSREQVVKYWGMPAKYYSFEKGGYLFVVLDGNDKKKVGKVGGYARYIGSEQRAWFKQVLKNANKPVICFSHQAIYESKWGVQNADEMLDIVKQHNKKSEFKIVAWMNGHNHLDRHLVKDDVLYLEVNSASYQWMGGGFKHKAFPEHVHNSYPYLGHVAAYKDPVYAILTIGNGKMKVEGVKSEWVGPSARERLKGKGHPDAPEFLEYYKPQMSDGEYKI